MIWVIKVWINNITNLSFSWEYGFIKNRLGHRSKTLVNQFINICEKYILDRLIELEMDMKDVWSEQKQKLSAHLQKDDKDEACLNVRMDKEGNQAKGKASYGFWFNYWWEILGFWTQAIHILWHRALNICNFSNI